jgi:tRNA (guanine37-N1)-methyltransferase
MLRIDFVSCVPGIFTSPLSQSIIQRAQDKGLVELAVHNLRHYTTNRHRKVDDYAYGGGAGMVMQAEPIAACIRSLQAERTYDEIIFLTPDGEPLTQAICNQLSLCQNLMLLAGHYKGVDQRVRDRFVTREISIGDYVLSGGELPALVLADALIRLQPGVLGDETSALSDSFMDGLLGPPVYSRPPLWEDMPVPEVLLGGNQAAIEAWRHQQSLDKTRQRRPDLLPKGEG